MYTYTYVYIYIYITYKRTTISSLAPSPPSPPLGQLLSGCVPQT